ncbi:MAG: hypothetical protein GY775_04380 [Candidatus Scalindua sp.]|nr:hypothetical protein [Candidatus Scalindua sp.]
MPISSNVEKEEDKPKAAEPSVVKDEFTTDKPVTKQDTPIFNARKSENKLSVVWNKDHLSEGSSIDEEKVAGHEGLKVLKKVEILEARLRGEEEEREKTAILVKELNEKLTALQAAEAAAAAKPGAGYLADGSTIGVGIVDGDDELRVLKKVKRLEARLSDEHEKIELLKKELTDLKSAKIIVENELANNKKLMQETSNDLLEKISALESTLKETESRAIAAEEALHPIKKELLKVQISETKAQQELYKLKIKKLQEEEE